MLHCTRDTSTAHGWQDARGRSYNIQTSPSPTSSRKAVELSSAHARAPVRILYLRCRTGTTLGFVKKIRNFECTRGVHQKMYFTRGRHTRGTNAAAPVWRRKACDNNIIMEEATEDVGGGSGGAYYIILLWYGGALFLAFSR